LSLKALKTTKENRAVWTNWKLYCFRWPNKRYL